MDLGLGVFRITDVVLCLFYLGRISFCDLVYVLKVGVAGGFLVVVFIFRVRGFCVVFSSRRVIGFVI